MELMDLISVFVPIPTVHAKSYGLFGDYYFSSVVVGSFQVAKGSLLAENFSLSEPN